ncbi:MAG TPA: glycosyltransferase family 2 protein [Anaerolineales bacterium]|nr:glycosyltransferase family 2 protein [Anaerolineales bacterium]
MPSLLTADMLILPLIFWFCSLLSAYTYLGYPALLWLLARLRPRRAFPLAGTPKVSLLIAAYNEQEVIAEKLENSLALDYPRERLQILVAADGSDDRTPEIIRSYAGRGVELSFQPARRGKTAALNRALAAVRGEILIFSDANNLYAPGAVRALLRPFADAQVGATTGAKCILEGDGHLGASEGLYWRYESAIKDLESRLSTCTAVAGEILAVRRALFEPFPEGIINDDFYLALGLIRRGFRVVYVPKARSYERVSPSAGDERLRRARITAGRYQFLALAGRLLPWKNPLVIWQVFSHKILRLFVPFAMLGAFTAAAAAVLWPARAEMFPALFLAPPYNWLYLVSQLAFYALALLGSLRPHQGLAGKLLYLPAFLVSSNLAALAGLVTFIRGKQAHLWRRAPRRSNPDILASATNRQIRPVEWNEEEA